MSCFVMCSGCGEHQQVHQSADSRPQGWPHPRAPGLLRFLLPLDIILHTPLIVQQRVAAGLGIQWAAAASQQAQPAAACRPVICVAQHAGSRLDRDPAASH